MSITPFTIYLLGYVQSISVLLGITFAVLFFTTVIKFIVYIDSMGPESFGIHFPQKQKYLKKMFIKSLIELFIIGSLFIVCPSRETLSTMILIEYESSEEHQYIIPEYMLNDLKLQSRKYFLYKNQTYKE